MNFKRTAAVLILGVSLGACSAKQNADFDASPIGVGLRNLTASQCANPQAAVANIPTGPLTNAQVLQIVDAFCAAGFGTVAAPATAPGMQPAIPVPAAPAAPAVKAK